MSYDLTTERIYNMNTKTTLKLHDDITKQLLTLMADSVGCMNTLRNAVAESKNSSGRSVVTINGDTDNNISITGFINDDSRNYTQFGTIVRHYDMPYLDKQDLADKHDLVLYYLLSVVFKCFSDSDDKVELVIGGDKKSCEFIHNIASLLNIHTHCLYKYECLCSNRESYDEV